MERKLLSLLSGVILSALIVCFLFLPANAGTAGTLNLTIEQGATFSYTLTYSLYDADNPPTYAGAAIDLTDYTARAQIRARLNSGEALIDLTTENGGIALGGAAGTIVITISAADTTTISDSGVWDLEIIETSTGNVTRIVQGSISLSREVTR